MIVGNSGVGKSSCLTVFCKEEFPLNFISTIGIDFKIQTREIDNKIVKLQIWDTAGQERFRSITTAYYRGAMGVLFVYDVTNQESFEAIFNTWLSNVRDHGTAGTPMVLVGNKAELEDKCQVSAENATEKAGKHGMMSYRVSAKEKMNIEEPFIAIARMVMQKMETEKKTGEGNSGVLDLHARGAQPYPSCCQ